MTKRFAILFIVLFYNVSVIKCQTYFSKRYPIVNHWGGGGLNVIENNDGYIAVTPPISTLSGKRNIAIMQTDFEGNVLFEKIYGDTTYSYNIGFQGSFQKVSTGGYIMFGNKEDTNRSYDLLYRFNDVGDLLWTKQLGDSMALNGYIGYNIKETLDSGFICIGVDGNGSNPVWIIKTDSLGNKQWEQRYGGPLWDVPSCIVVCNDGGYIYSASTKNGGVGLPKENIRIMKIDSLGNVVFNKFFGGVESDNAWSIIQTQDGGYLFGGNYTFLDVGCNCLKSNPYVIKLNSLGDTLWTRKYGQAMNAATILNMSELNDGSIILCGLTRFENQTSGDWREQGLVFKISANGDSLFYRLYRLLSSNSSHELRDIKPTIDGGFICAGIIYPRSPDIGTQDMWLLKLDSLGCADTACALATTVEEEPQLTNLGIFNLYPNPNQGMFTIEYNLIEENNLVLEIISVTGQVIYKKYLEAGSTVKKIEATTLTSGIYFLIIKNQANKIVFNTKIGVTK